MASTTILSTEFNGSNVTVSQPKAVEVEVSGKRQVVGKKAFVNYNGERLALQSATSMRIPFGLSVFTADGGGPSKYSINLSFNGYQQAGEVKAFYDAIVALDKAVLDQAVANSKAWFGKEKSREVLQEFYTPSIKFGKDGSKDYPPTMKLNLKRIGETFETRFYDVKGKKFTGLPAEEMLAKGAQVTALMECADVWIAGTGKFNLRWNVTQLIIHKLPDRGGEFAFKMPAGGMVGDDAPSASASASAAPAPKASNVVIASAEEDDDEDDVDEAEEDALLTKRHAEVVAATTVASVVAAVLPPDDDEEDAEAPPLPVKKAPTIVKKKPVVVAKKG